MEDLKPRAKKSLGQNFLINQGVIERIVRLAEVGSDDTVLEIGPGRGILTRALAARAGRLIAVEKDDRLAAELKAEFADYAHVTIRPADILDCELGELVPPGSKVVANLPYNISTVVIARLCALANPAAAMVFMVQKEVAERLIARPGDPDYSSLSVLVAATHAAKPGFLVGPENFRPRPRVDSMVIRLTPLAAPIAVDETFRRVVQTAFNQRRKMLRKSWLNLPAMDKERLEHLAAQARIDLSLRPERLTPEDFRRMTDVLLAAG
ncbi:MAG: Ribosomal RNA small subunit methyltransferase A [Deltaproteobacteria bacterium ADurb.Bin510]|nr:MAG: Ribosomal RNA small subunit methyltransferase A [Deltaproteobacteria bacterium ADurb.Bin510]